MLWSILETVYDGAFKPLAIVFSTLVNLLVGISGALVMKESHSICKNVFWENTGEC